MLQPATSSALASNLTSAANISLFGANVAESTVAAVIEGAEYERFEGREAGISHWLEKLAGC